MSELNCMNCRIGDFKSSLCDCDSSFYAKYKGIGTGKDFIDALTTKCIPSTQPDSCEYCYEDADGFVTPLEKNGHAFVRFGMNGWELSLRANGWCGSAKIRYCPMCGRDLFVK